MGRDGRSVHGRDWQLHRFCLYGFLKNLQFFDPFLILAFRDRGLSFTTIGTLISFRAVCVNLMEVPSGAAADAWGRRRAMMCSMVAYILSFLLLALATTRWLLFPAMFLFAVGEAFRTGTHKAMIFDWLSKKGREGEKTRVYGLTRSWSKYGSSINCIVAAAVVIKMGDYRWVFLLAVIPYMLNVLNFAFYPAWLDRQPRRDGRRVSGLTVLKAALREIFSCKRLSTLIAENVCFEGVFSVVKDYLQPTLKVVALSAPVLLGASGHVRTAILVAAVYFLLNLASGVASMGSHKAVERVGSERRLALIIWALTALLYGVMFFGFHSNLTVPTIVAFVALFVLLNVWKPVFVSRFHDHATNDTAATTLSIANQSKTLAVAVLAPFLGHLVDRHSIDVSAALSPEWLRPVALIGLAAAVAGILFNRVFRDPPVSDTSATAGNSC